VARITVRVTPRAGRDAVDGFDGEGHLRVRVAAPPADGQANKAVARLLATTLGLASRDVVLVSGATSRLKVFDLPLVVDEVRERLT